MHHIEITFTGGVLDLKVELEGKEVGLYFDGRSEWRRTLEKFSIDGMLDVVMLCKGINGTAWKLDINIDDNVSKNYSGKIDKGYALLNDKIEVPDKN